MSPPAPAPSASRALVWLLRLGADRHYAARLERDPVLFATWYAFTDLPLDWPSAAQAVLDHERGRKLSLERMFALLSRFDFAHAEKPSAEYARRLLEGYALHTWARGTGYFPELVHRCATVSEQLNQREWARAFASDTLSARLTELAQALELTGLEQELVLMGLLSGAVPPFAHLIERALASGGGEPGAAHLWQVLLATDAAALGKALAVDAPLRRSGLLQPRGTYKGKVLAVVSPAWAEVLTGEAPLVEALLEPYQPDAGAGLPAKMADDDFALLASALAGEDTRGVNLMLYGAAGLDKRRLLLKLLGRVDRAAWRVRPDPDAERDAPSRTFVAMRCLAQRAGERVALVVENTERVLQPTPSEFMRELFGLTLDSDGERPFEQQLLDTAPVPVLWLTVDPQRLSTDTVARFSLHVPLKRASKTEQRELMTEALVELKLSAATRDALLALDGLSLAQVDAARRTAQRVGGGKREREATLLQVARRSQKALGRERARSTTSVTEYSVRFLNTAGRFGPEQIMRALKRQPRASICLYGPPGTGKTQFAEHLAQHLRMPLLARHASDLLSKWVGESEKNIAAMFAEAAQDEAVLLLDEGDSFLRKREFAEQSWQVSQVNELLQHMERFEGVFILCTNLFHGLDAAALRRFTFKVEFRQLSAEQRWAMFINETGLKGKLGGLGRLRDEWEERLLLMPQLTPGDFATVKRQALLLGETLTPEQWLEQLDIEVQAKAHGRGTEMPGTAR